MHPAAVTGYDQPLLAIISPATVQQESAKFRVYTLPPSSDYATPGREPHEPRAQRELNYQLLSTPSLTMPAESHFPAGQTPGAQGDQYVDQGGIADQDDNDDYICSILQATDDEEGLWVASTASCTMPDGLTHFPNVEAYYKDPATGVTFGRSKLFNEAAQAELEQLLLVECADVLSHSLKDLSGYSGVHPPCTVELKHDKPIFERRRNHSALEKQIEEEKCGEMLEAGLIEPSRSSMYASNLTFPAKRDAEGQWTDRRMCMDLRAINEATVFDRYGMPNPNVALQEILGDHCFSVLDLRAGYHQIPIVELDRDKTSFWWGTKLYRYVRMVMGMRNATAQFQRVIDFELQDAGLTHCACGYVDDILVHSPTPEQHIKDLRAVLSALRRVNLKVHPRLKPSGTWQYQTPYPGCAQLLVSFCTTVVTTVTTPPRPSRSTTS